jgi:Major Facilitator Superfamily
MASVPQASPDSSITNTSGRSEQWATILECLSIPPQLAFGYLGLLLFMMGDGVEAGYLAHFLHGEGFSQGKVALLFTIYGAISAMAARYSGAIADVWGPRLAMLTGLLVWIAFQVIFLGFALPMGSFHLILISYGLRGLGYPLFAYGFLVLVTNVTPPRRLASAVGWFWFAFSAGLPTLGSFFASYRPVRHPLVLASGGDRRRNRRPGRNPQKDGAPRTGYSGKADLQVAVRKRVLEHVDRLEEAEDGDRLRGADDQHRPAIRFSGVPADVLHDGCRLAPQ